MKRSTVLHGINRKYSANTFNPKQLLPFVDVFFIIFVLCIFSKQLETMKWNLVQL